MSRDHVSAVDARHIFIRSAVGGFSSILANIEEHGPLRRNVTGQDVGETARYLLSDMGRGVTGQIIRVDCGTSAVAGLG